MIVTAATNDNKYIDIYDTRASNFNYRDGVYVTAKSAVENSGLRVLMQLINYKLFETNANSINGGIHIVYEQTDCFATEKDFMDYSNFARFRIIADLMKRRSEIKGFIWLDADTIVRKDISSMIAFPETDRCILRIQVRSKEGRANDGFNYNNGVFAINNTEQSREYLNAVYTACNEEGDWLSGQRQMYYEAKKRNVIVEPFNWMYNDSGFREESHIWHSKGKFFKDEWQREFKHYLGDE